jgi:hypothetical protein
MIDLHYWPPAIVDHAPAGGGDRSRYSNQAILLYLAQKTGRVGGADLRSRTELPQCEALVRDNRCDAGDDRDV